MENPAPRAVDFWGLDSQYWSYRKLFVHNIHHSIVSIEKERRLEFFYLRRPVSRVEVMGVITDISNRRSKIWLTLDDGTGIVHCVKYINENSYNNVDPIKGAKVGSLFTVRGSLQRVETNEFPYSFTISIASLDIVEDANMELFQWTSVMYLHKYQYDREWQRPLGLVWDGVHDIREKTAQFCSCAINTMESLVFGADLHSKGVTLVESTRSHRAAEVRARWLFCRCLASELGADPYCHFRIDLVHLLGQQHNEFLQSQQKCEHMLTASATSIPLQVSLQKLRCDRKVCALARRYHFASCQRISLETEDIEVEAEEFTGDLGSSSEDEASGQTTVQTQGAAQNAVLELLHVCLDSLRQDGLLLPAQTAGVVLEGHAVASQYVLADVDWLLAQTRLLLAALPANTSSTSSLDGLAVSSSSDFVAIGARNERLVARLRERFPTVPAWRWHAVLQHV